MFGFVVCPVGLWVFSEDSGDRKLFVLLDFYSKNVYPNTKGPSLKKSYYTRTTFVSVQICFNYSIHDYSAILIIHISQNFLIHFLVTINHL